MLKESWEGISSLPVNLGKTTVDFLQDLRQKLETVRSYAENHNAAAQQRFVNRYNLRARERHFKLGDQVLLHSPDNTMSRTFSRWRGPARIVEVRSPHSYVIDLDAVRQHVHANRLKRFLVASDAVICCPDFESVLILCHEVNRETDALVSEGCAIISDSDIDFGDVKMFEQTPLEQKTS